MDIRTITTSFGFLFLVTALTDCVALASVALAIRSIRPDITRRWKIISFLVVILFWTAASVATLRVYNTLRAVPTIRLSNPKNDLHIDRLTSTIYAQFKAPVLFDSLSVHTFPEQELKITPHKYLWGLLPLGTKLTIQPQLSLPPNEKILVYFSNLEGPFTKGYGGEQQLDYHTEDISARTEDFSDNAEHVPADLSLTYVIGGSPVDVNEWRATIDPATTELTVRKINDKMLEVGAKDPLRQGTSYSLALHFTPIIYTITGRDEYNRLDERAVSTLHLTTVKPALIESFTPEGNSVNPVTELQIVFKEKMDVSNAQQFFTIDPPVKITTKWSADNTILTVTHDEFTKNKEFVFVLKKGLKTHVGGTLENDVTYRFRTAGPLTVMQVTPNNSATAVDVRTPVRVMFDQDIPPETADKLLFIPVVPGKKTVSNNVFEFTPNSPLSAETRYTVKIPAGISGVYGLPSSSEQSYTFTTSPNTLALNVPYMRQESLFTCNISAARMLLAFRGATVTEKQLIDKIGSGGKRGSGNPYKGYIDDYGTYWDAVSRGVTAWRPTRIITGGNLNDIIAELKKGNPVMIWGQNGWSDPHEISWTATDGTYIRAVNGMHSAVVRGFSGPDGNPTNIYINDPWRGQYAIPTAEFTRRWGYFKVAMVVD